MVKTRHLYRAWMIIAVFFPAVLAMLVIVSGCSGNETAGKAESKQKIAQQFPHEIGTIVTVAGNGSSGYSGDDGPSINAQLYNVFSVAIDSAQNLYIVDWGNSDIRKVDNKGIITTLADGQHLQTSPNKIAFDKKGNLFLTCATAMLQAGPRVLKIDPDGNVTNVVSTDPGSSGDGGPAALAKLTYPTGIAFSPSGELYIADNGSNKIRKIDSEGIISTVAGTGEKGYSGDGRTAKSARLSWIEGICFDTEGNLYIADCGNNRIRKVDAAGIISTVAGTGKAAYSGDGGPAASASLNGPMDVKVNSKGELLIADCDNNRIRKIDGNGIITTIAGNGTKGNSGNGIPAETAEISPSSVAVDNVGNIYLNGHNSARVIVVAESPLLASIPKVAPGSAESPGDGYWQIKATYVSADGTKYTDQFWYDSKQNKMVAFQSGTEDDPAMTTNDGSNWTISGDLKSGNANVGLQQIITTGNSRTMTQEVLYANGQCSVVVQGTDVSPARAEGTWSIVEKKAEHP
jgi:sugar lactone lactonase YvrE